MGALGVTIWPVLTKICLDGCCGQNQNLWFWLRWKCVLLCCLPSHVITMFSNTSVCDLVQKQLKVKVKVWAYSLISIGNECSADFTSLGHWAWCIPAPFQRSPRAYWWGCHLGTKPQGHFPCPTKVSIWSQQCGHVVWQRNEFLLNAPSGIRTCISGVRQQQYWPLIPLCYLATQT